MLGSHDFTILLLSNENQASATRRGLVEVAVIHKISIQIGLMEVKLRCHLQSIKHVCSKLDIVNNLFLQL